MRKLNIKRQSGFTIIEVLIVLAIAGLILLVVFLAVPGLQRNAHNTTAKNDVASILGAMSEYVDNNSGSLPPAEAAGSMGSGGTLYVGDTAANCSASSSTKNCATAKIGYYDAGSVAISATVPSAPAVGSVVIVLKTTCNGNVPAAPSSATPRGYAAYYTLEGGAIQCQAS